MWVEIFEGTGNVQTPEYEVNNAAVVIKMVEDLPPNEPSTGELEQDSAMDYQNNDSYYIDVRNITFDDDNEAKIKNLPLGDYSIYICRKVIKIKVTPQSYRRKIMVHPLREKYVDLLAARINQSVFQKKEG